MIPNASILSLLFGSTLFIGLLALGAYLVYYVLFIVIPRSRINTHKKEGVSTYFFPIGGFLHCLLQNFKQKNDFIYDLKHVSKTMPNPKYVATHIGKTFYIVLQDTKYIKEFLRKHASYKKTHFIYTMMPLMGNSLIIAEGETWKHHRRIISSAFTFDFLRENTPRIQQITKEILDKLTPEDYKNYSTLYNIQDITGEVIGRIIFGENLCNHKFDGKTLPRALNGIMEDISHIGLNHWFIIFGPRSMGLLSMTKYRNVMQRVKRFRKAVLDIVQARKKQANSGSGNDLLSILLATQKAKDPKDRFSDSDIVDEFITFLTVGMDNPGHLITMTLYNLTQHPEYLAKLQEERDKTYNQEKVITPDTLSKMDLLHAVFKETLRVYTPAPALFIREAIEDHEILDLKVKKGDMMNYAFSTPAMDNKYFEDADRFNPERWANQDPNLDPYAFTPFSAGQRNCIGQNLAILESKIIVSEFLERFNFNLQDGYKLRMSFRFLYEPREEMIMNLQPK